MEKLEFRNACYEVLEILKYVKEDDLNKIPKEEIQLLKDNANYNHKFKYNPTLSMKEQNISKMAKGIIAVYFEQYTATKEQKEIIKAKRIYDLRKEKMKEREMTEKNHSMLKENVKIEEQEPRIERNLVKYENEKWYNKLLRRLGFLYSKSRAAK